MKQVAVIGSGIVGRNWCVIYAKSYKVCLYDISESQLNEALVEIRQNILPNLLTNNIINENEMNNIINNIIISKVLNDAIKDAIHIQTCVPENLDIKSKLFMELDSLLHERKDDEYSICSSTSNIKPSLFTETLKIRAHCMVAHPINPPLSIPCVELVPSAWTSKNVIENVQKIMINVNMKPILLKKEVDGFIVNRLQYALLAEAYRLVADGVCDVTFLIVLLLMV